jgi:hypothetical protein
MALLWLASRVSIWTLREQMVQHDRVIWKNWFNLDSFDDANVSDDWRRANSANTPPELLGRGAWNTYQDAPVADPLPSRQ